ncbi:non-ribosomal peptide synthetase [Cellulosilyticum ruminicola]|uniref:non-ribosomal peptide synthetase n=1 Tax=Cellulosilyticum ruminicola TaxID=425254 RepID=UPI00155DA18F|nr:non-ribosomal peptide synthetase [Cellulosilyticum ruminicola]
MELLEQGQGISPNVEGITAKGLISDAFEKYSNESAIWFENREMTFAELEERVNVLANYLVSKGAKSGQVVAMLLERTPDLIATLLAIQTIGATWLPLDIAFPEERLSYMLQKSQAQYLIYSRKGILGNFRELDIVGIDINDVQEVPNIQEVNYESKVVDIAYVIFTSGSTGKPKGTAIEQGALANFIVGMKESLEYQEKGRIACMTTASFDIFLLETVFCLAHGGCIVLGKEDEVINPEKIANLVCAGNVNYLQITPTRLQLLCTNKEASRKVLQHINTLIVGGEAFPNHLLSTLQEYKNLRIFNVYGPTETCIWSACKELTYSQDVTIGLPIANTQIYILDARKQLVPNLVEGDLWIGGKGVARGYIGDANLTNERFIKNPFGEGRMYCTGDRAKWENGELVCLGRADNQVKIRGYRIELEEIEQVIKNYQGISNAAANIYELTPGNKILVAYFSSAEKGKIEVEEVKEWLRSQLPDYMVPAILMEIPKIPQTYNGKVDRNALPVPERKEEIKEDISNPIDKKLVAIWKRILGDQDIALNDNFFDIGGNSFNLVLMQAELEQDFEGIFEVTDLFSNPTIIKQRQFIESNMKNDSHIGTFSISPEWIEINNGEEGCLQVALEHKLNQSMQQIGNTYHLNVQGIIGALFAVCLNKVGNMNMLPVWFSNQNGELDLVSFDFNAYETLDEVFEEIHKVKHYTLANVDIVLDKCEEIRACTVLNEKEMADQMSDYFDIMIGIDKQQENIVFKYSNRLNKDALEQFIGQFMNLLYSMFNIKEEDYE